MNENTTYIFGHRNPDTDSVCGAISLAYLKNNLGINCIPAILGEINQETKYALDFFNVKQPYHLNDVKLQIKDVFYHKNCYANKNLSIKAVFDIMTNYSLTGIPIVDNKNKYYGYVSLKEIARELINGNFEKINTSYENLIKTLNATAVLQYDKEIIGKIFTASLAKETFIDKVVLDTASILIVGDRKTILDYAIKSKVKLIILVGGSNILNDTLIEARKNKINIISTPLTAYEVGKSIFLANYIKDIIRLEGSTTVNEVDYLSDFVDLSKKLKHTNYPVINNRNDCLGVLTLTDCNEVLKKQVILVDHNNFSQSVDGLEEADILEVIDHHNIGDVNTKKPINFRNASTGSVNTIIYSLFKENGVKIPRDIAGLMLSAIISDTLLLTSPTTTLKDKEALMDLCRIAKVKYKEYGAELLKHGMSIKRLTNEDLLYRDFKSYKVDDKLIGIGQILISDFSALNKKIASLTSYINKISNTEKYEVLLLVITNIFENKSCLIFNNSAQEIIKDSFKLNEIYEGVILNNVVSRKSQIVPYIMDTIEKNK